jgi:co-chaperonin GroES (HSP10)
MAHGMVMQLKDVEEVPAHQRPVPVGYKILCSLIEIEEKTTGGIYLTNKQRQEERTASQILKVVAMGSEAYQDEEKFPAPWCTIGDYIVVRPFAGVRIMVKEQEFRLIDEDMVEAVIPDPTLVTSL